MPQCEGCPIGPSQLEAWGLSPEEISCGMGEPEIALDPVIDGVQAGGRLAICTSPEVTDARAEAELSPVERFARAVRATPEQIAEDQALIRRVLKLGE